MADKGGIDRNSRGEINRVQANASATMAITVAKLYPEQKQRQTGSGAKSQHRHVEQLVIDGDACTLKETSLQMKAGDGATDHSARQKCGDHLPDKRGQSRIENEHSWRRSLAFAICKTPLQQAPFQRADNRLPPDRDDADHEQYHAMLANRLGDVMPTQIAETHREADQKDRQQDSCCGRAPAPRTHSFPFSRLPRHL